MSDGAGDRRPGGAGGNTRLLLGAGLGAVVGLLLWALVLKPGPTAPGGEATSATTAATTVATAAASTAKAATDAASSSAPASTDTAATTAATTAPAPAPAPTPPSFDTVRVDPNGSVLVAGRADPGASVDLRVDGTTAGTAAADATGSFATFLTLPPSDKPRVLSMVTRGADGAEVLAGADVVLQPTPAPTVVAAAAATTTAPTTGTTTATSTEPAAATTPTDTASAAPTPEAAPAAPLVVDAQGVSTLATGSATSDVRIGTIGYDEAGAVDVSGEGRPDGTVRLYVDEALVATLPVTPEGRWRTKLGSVAPGLHTLRADQVDTDGKVLSRAETPFQREDPSRVATAAPTLGEASGASGTKPRTQAQVVTVQPGFTLWAIARDTYGSGVLYVKVFDANKDQIRNPDLIYPGQVFTLPDGG